MKRRSSKRLEVNTINRLQPVEEVTLAKLNTLPDIQFDAHTDNEVLLWFTLGITVLIILCIVVVVLLYKRQKPSCIQIKAPPNDTNTNDQKCKTPEVGVLTFL